MNRKDLLHAVRFCCVAYLGWWTCMAPFKQAKQVEQTRSETVVIQVVNRSQNRRPVEGCEIYCCTGRYDEDGKWVYGEKLLGKTDWTGVLEAEVSVEHLIYWEDGRIAFKIFAAPKFENLHGRFMGNWTEGGKRIVIAVQHDDDMS